ncbi:MAG: endonuclease domain-containing protein, partial [Chloroflexi bacterium]|nr:endonuclease domain-containing protein [Chloroflexota bacterium]
KNNGLQKSRAEHLAELMRLSGSELESDWLRFLEQHNLRLPSRAQMLIPECNTRPDFLYDEQKVAVYVDGPHHTFSERAVRDHDKAECLNDHGYVVLRFSSPQDWSEEFRRFNGIFA